MASGNYEAADLLVVRGIAEDVAFPFVDFNGDLIEFFGSNPSGQPLTVIVNSIANSLYMRYCYRVLNPNQEAKTFKSNVRLMTYGDDNVMSVNPTTQWFNHTSISTTLEAVGIGYTMADKDAKSVPYIPFDEVTFLKRKFVYDKDIDAIVCPIDEDSIHKVLTMGVVSRDDSREKQAADVLQSVVREYFWYGRTSFEQHREMMMRIAVKSGIEDWMAPFPTWEELKTAFDEASARRQSC